MTPSLPTWSITSAIRLPISSSAAELVATEKKSLGQIIKQLEQKAGEFHTDRINLRMTQEQKDALLKKLAAGLDFIGPFKVEKFVTIDGYKFILPQGEWVSFRASGTDGRQRKFVALNDSAFQFTTNADELRCRIRLNRNGDRRNSPGLGKNKT